MKEFGFYHSIAIEDFSITHIDPKSFFIEFDKNKVCKSNNSKAGDFAIGNNCFFMIGTGKSFSAGTLYNNGATLFVDKFIYMPTSLYDMEDARQWNQTIEQCFISELNVYKLDFHDY